MNEPRWLSRPLVDLIHSSLITEHGGSFGVRDDNLIDSALDRPRNKWAYEEATDLAGLAAAYGYGLVTNHGYVDGNKRVAFMAAYIFLGLNDRDLEAPEPEVVRITDDLAASRVTEEQFALWIRDHISEP